MSRRHHCVTLLQASQESPTLARLTELTAESSRRLKAIEMLIPAGLRGCLQAGPVEGATWCLLVDSTAAASKVRQLLPVLTAHLRTHGTQIEVIRLKVRTRR